MAVMMVGSASTSVGMAAIKPSANPVISCKAASSRSGMFSRRVCTTVVIICTTAGINSGSASAMPDARVATI